MKRLASETEIGSTGVRVPRLGFGGAQIGNLYEAVPEPRVAATLQRAYDAGLSLFDTSPFYGIGLSELRLGHFLRGQPRDSYVLSTKVGRVIVPRGQSPDSDLWTAPLPFDAVFDYSYDGAMRSLEQSTLRLGLPRIDIALVHDADRRNHGAAIDRVIAEVMGGAYRALDEARRAGNVGAIGVAVNDADVAARFVAAGDFDCVLLGGTYSLLEQPAVDGFFARPETHGIPVLLGGIFNSGILAAPGNVSGPYHYAPPPPEIAERRRRLVALAETFAVSIAAASVQFALAQPTVASAIIGMAHPERVDASVAALDATIPADFWSALKTSGFVHPDAPVPKSPVATVAGEIYP